MDSQTSTHTSTSEPVNQRPEDRVCVCGHVNRPYLRPAIPNLGITARWMDPSDVCDACQDKAASERAEAAKLLQDRERVEGAFKAARISPRFKERTFENYRPNAQTQKAYQSAKDYVPVTEGLVFFGPCGTGKTHLAAAIANKFILEMPVLFVSCPELLMDIRENMRPGNPINSLDVAKQVQLLIVDDIGAEKSTEWVRETLFVLVNHRYEHKLPTIFTTNCTVSQLSEKLSERIASRIMEMCRVIHVGGEDYRLKR